MILGKSNNFYGKGRGEIMMNTKLFLGLLLLPFLSGCLGSTKPAHELRSCLLVKEVPNIGNVFYKIVGLSDTQYTLRTCQEQQLRQQKMMAERFAFESQPQAPGQTRAPAPGKAPAPAPAPAPLPKLNFVEDCFSSDVTQMDFKTFESMALMPILCEEIR